MDGVVMASVFILVIIVAIEGFCLFSSKKLKRDNTSFVLIFPVFDEDMHFKERLEDMKSYIQNNGTEGIIVVNVNASAQRLFLINEFCMHNNIKEIIPYSMLEKKLCEIFAIEAKK
jgi:hypothetical protein